MLFELGPSRESHYGSNFQPVLWFLTVFLWISPQFVHPFSTLVGKPSEWKTLPKNGSRILPADFQYFQCNSQRASSGEHSQRTARWLPYVPSCHCFSGASCHPRGWGLCPLQVRIRNCKNMFHPFSTYIPGQLDNAWCFVEGVLKYIEVLGV